jgi:gliding motility-associated-like protein
MLLLRLTLFLIPFFGSINLFGQVFFKRLNVPNPGIRSRILGLKGGEIALLSNDSILLRFTACGALQKGLSYSFPGLKILSGTNNITTRTFFKLTSNGGYALLNRVKRNQKNQAMLTKLDSLGNVVFSFVLDDNVFEQYPYSLDQDRFGNLFIYSNLGRIGGGEPYNNLSKFSPDGILLWSRSYNRGWSYGEGFCTTDNGFLFRTGNTLVKTNSDGEVVWTRIFLVNATPYVLPYEGDNGYWIPLNVFFNQTGLYSWYMVRVSKDGQQVLEKRKFQMNLTHTPFRKKKDGGWIRADQIQRIRLNGLPQLSEYDQDFNLIRSNVLNLVDYPETLAPVDLQVLEDGSVLMAGRYFNWNVFLNGESLVLARTNPQLGTGCSDSSTVYQNSNDSLALNSQLVPTTSFPFSWNLVPQTATIRNVTFSDTTYCGNQTSLDLGKDTSFCEGVPQKLANKTAIAFNQYIWSNGSQAKEITIDQPGKYWVRAIDNCQLDTLVDTVQIKIRKIPEIGISRTNIFCGDEPVRLVAKIPDAKIRWQDGSTDTLFLANAPGDYFVDVEVGNCIKRFETRISECEKLEMPTLFTPNSDPWNEIFEPKHILGIAEASMEIYNRWGKRIAVVSDLKKEGWNGKGHPDGVYFWVISFVNKDNVRKRQVGQIVLMDSR